MNKNSSKCTSKKIPNTAMRERENRCPFVRWCHESDVSRLGSWRLSSFDLLGRATKSAPVYGDFVCGVFKFSIYLNRFDEGIFYPYLHYFESVPPIMFPFLLLLILNLEFLKQKNVKVQAHFIVKVSKLSLNPWMKSSVLH